MTFNEMKKYYNGKRVFVTGHTGFKGAWLCKILNLMGAEVYGYSLLPSTEPSIYNLLQLDNLVHSTIGDVRDFEGLKNAMEKAKPEYVFHLAAQPLVRESYRIPRETFDTNVMGTVNLLECIRLIPDISSVLVVTTDKVYENKDLIDYAFKEDDKLDGYDPYSNSKSCAELVTHSYIKSFFNENSDVSVSTARAGNVIGGGDFSADRIIPDCVRAMKNKETIGIRNPYSIRPYQHVLEPLIIYMTIAVLQRDNPELSGYYNIGPDVIDCITTGELADMFIKYWGENASWINIEERNSVHEAGFLKLDCSKLKKVFGWQPTWNIEESVKNTVLWYKVWINAEDIIQITEKQIREFMDYGENENGCC